MERSFYMLDEFADLIVIQSRPRTQITCVDLERFKNISLAPSVQPKAQKTVDDQFKRTA